MWMRSPTRVGQRIWASCRARHPEMVVPQMDASALPAGVAAAVPSYTERLTMAQNPSPSDPEVAGWLHTLGVASLCQWDVLVFLYRHQTTLLGAADLARLLGYPSD